MRYDALPRPPAGRVPLDSRVTVNRNLVTTLGKQELVATAVKEIDGTNKRDRDQNDKGGQKNENDHGRLLRT